MCVLNEAKCLLKTPGEFNCQTQINAEMAAACVSFVGVVAEKLNGPPKLKEV